MSTFDHIDLFSGIGGFALGLEAVGEFRTTQFVEIDSFCRAVLAQRFPGVPIHDDVVTFRGRRERGRPLVVTAGFPCQDVSAVGQRAGLNAERSGLWFESARIAGELRPDYFIVENVTGLLTGDRGQWFATVLADLAALGFDAEWHCVPAAYFGAPHRRDRVWLVAYPSDDHGATVWEQSRRRNGTCWARAAELAKHGLYRFVPNRGRELLERRQSSAADHGPRIRCDAGGWAVEPDVGRVAYGIPDRVDRLSSLGNSIVPQIAAWLGFAILEHYRRST